MATNTKNRGQILESWTPMIKQTTGVEDNNKLAWMAELAHNQAMHLNEAAMGGVGTPYSTLYNTPGIGNAVPATKAGMTLGQQFAGDTKGSGDKWPSLLPLALQVAARTVGLDLVNTTPFQGPTGVLPFLDYVYAGGKQPYGAPPAHNPGSANPEKAAKSWPAGGVWDPAYNAYEIPYAFKINLRPAQLDASASEALVDGSTMVVFTNSTGDASIVGQFISKSRIDAFPMFKIASITAGKNLSDVFNGVDGMKIKVGETAEATAVAAVYPTLISMLEDQIKGFTGSGPYDTDPWTGTFVNPEVIYDPMMRGVGEMVYPRALSLEVFTKFVQVGTEQISISVTQEQVTDLQKQWGIDVIKLVENAAINELSQSINKNITSKLFALGWLNHIKAYESEGINLNMDLTTSQPGAKFANAVPVDPAESTNNGKGYEVRTMPLVPFYQLPVGTGSFENQDTIIKRIQSNILYAGNVITQRGRRGPATFIVTNVKIGTALQTNSQYSFSPIANTMSQNNGSLYPLGTIAGMTVYIDPLMANDDTRVLIGRKGANDEPGLHFCPYLMAESVRLIAEGTGAPKVLLKSRYAIVAAGWFPETQYLTMYIKTTGGII